MQYITILDFIILPFVLAVVYGLAYKQRNKKYPPGHPWRRFYLPGLTVKVVGAIFIGLIYQYYYGGGDTFNYFRQARVINSAASDSLIKWFNLLLRIPGPYESGYYEYISRLHWYDSPANYAVCSITGLFSIFTGGTYLPTAVVFAYVSFTGIWALFRTFASLYARLVRPIAFAILFIPSTVIWGSGIFKDTICMFGLGWLTYASFRFLVQKDFSLKNIVLASVSFVLIATVKIYILLGFIPALVMWILFIYTQKIKSVGPRLILKLAVIAITATGFLFLMQRFGEEYLGRYSLENVEETAEATRRWITYSSEQNEGSAYNLGEFDPSFSGMLTKFPLAVNVTLFRPYLWEAGKVIVFLSAIEAFLLLFLTLKVLFVIGPKKIFKSVNENPTIQFCLTFSIIFAFAVGVSSYNFGALSRYKIPCLPFYVLSLVLIFYKNSIRRGQKLLGKLV